MLHNATLNLYQVYPRACGRTTIFMGNTETVGSLSPRVRGNHRHFPVGRQRARSIPARAGEPRFWPISRWLIKVYPLLPSYMVRPVWIEASAADMPASVSDL